MECHQEDYMAPFYEIYAVTEGDTLFPLFLALYLFFLSERIVSRVVKEHKKGVK
jgi:hypothetical protein